MHCNFIFLWPISKGSLRSQSLSLHGPLVQLLGSHFVLRVGVLRDVVVVARDVFLAEGAGDLHLLCHQVGRIVFNLVAS